MILMGFSIDTEKFLINSKEAYYKFQKHQTPFAAIKVYCSGLGDEREKVDGIVDNNFRSDKDFILRSENNYAILMHNTSLKTAEAVMNRISKKLSKMRYEAKIITTAQINAYACIYGTENAKIQFRHLDLINPSVNTHETDNGQNYIREYLRWTEPIRSMEYTAFSIKV